MTTHPSAQSVPTESLQCFGCAAPVKLRALSPRHRPWCKRCSALASDFYSIERAERLLRQYGLAGAAQTVLSALQDMQALVRKDDGFARELARAATRRRRTTWNLLEDLRPLTELEPRADTGPLEALLFGDLPPFDPYALGEFARTTTGDEDPAAMLHAARAYLLDHAAPQRASSTWGRKWSEADLLEDWPDDR